MNHDSEKWLDDRISEDVDRMADKRIKELMESEELKDIEATMDQLQSIRKRLGLVDAEDEHDMESARELTPEVPAHSHVKAASEESTTSEAAAAKAEDGDESTTKVNNNDSAVASSYDEEEVCQEIEDQLGVLPVRFGYRPKDMILQEYWIKEDAKETVLKYASGNKKLHIYISKDYDNSSINFKVDGDPNEIVKMSAMRMEIPVYQYEDTDKNQYYQVSFEYLNTYYSLSGLMNKEEFEQILENIYIKNV